MNEAFYELPKEKQRAVYNAAMEVFGEYEYKRASTDLIASKAGVSPSNTKAAGPVINIRFCSLSQNISSSPPKSFTVPGREYTGESGGKICAQ